MDETPVCRRPPSTDPAYGFARRERRFAVDHQTTGTRRTMEAGQRGRGNGQHASLVLQTSAATLRSLTVHHNPTDFNVARRSPCRRLRSFDLDPLNNTENQKPDQKIAACGSSYGSGRS